MPIKVCFTDFPGPANPDAILHLLKEITDVVVDQVDPEIVFFSVFGYKFLEYPEALRIFFTGENVHPDFNLCDYAFGFDWMSFGDRYYRCPNFLLYSEFNTLCQTPIPSQKQINEVLSRPRFCNFIYSNANAHPYRDELFHLLNGVKKVDSVGLHLNNTGVFRGSPSLGTTATQDKISFQRECRFSIAAENSSSPGYTTEKLVHALVAGTIPIYWGDPMVGKQFNSHRFINCHEFSSPAAVVARVAEIEESPVLAAQILSEPIFLEGRIPDVLKIENLSAHLEFILSQSHDSAFRRNRFVWGKTYEERRKKETAARSLQRFRKFIGGIKNRILPKHF